MLRHETPALDAEFDVQPDPDEFIRAGMDWHFSPTTGSPFWLKRAESVVHASALVADPTISNVYVGDHPTNLTEPGIPHDG